jgi:hypothetical protein
MDTTVLQPVISPIAGDLFQTIILSIFIIVPIVAAVYFWKSWVKYVRGAFFSQQKYVLLELGLPKGLAKSPLAMELFITSLYQTGGEGTWYDKFWLGKSRVWFSLEIVSIDGGVGFFLWTRENMRAYVETQLYAQFPDIEISQVADYANTLNFSWETHQMWGCDFKKGEASHLPIKTYKDYGLDKDPKEEFKVDPITSMLEFLGSIGRGEQVWFQFIIRAHKKELTKPGTWFEKVDWKHAANEDIKKLMKRDDKSKAKGEEGGDSKLTKGEKTRIEAIENNISKLPFDSAFRAIYVAEKDKYNGGAIPGITGALRQYNVLSLNGFAPTNTTGYDYPWQDFTGKKTMGKKEKMLFLYRNRSAFFPEFFPDFYEYKPFVMTTEELATVYHFPGDVSRTPTLNRSSAKRVEAPANLPI